MRKIDFKPGRLDWLVITLTADQIRDQYLRDVWDDGFLAFSNQEQRLGDNGLALLNACLAGRADASGGPEGYLMEAGIWRTRGTAHEELYLEREGDLFIVQQWCLKTAGFESLPDCYYREAGTFVRGNLGETFKGPLASFEVVVPDHRLRFYLTTGVKP